MELNELVPIVYEYCKPDKQEELKKFSKQFSEVKDFAYTWKLWGNWEKNVPVIAESAQKGLIGFQAVTLSKRTGYINFYYHAVHPDAQGHGIAKDMLDFYLTTKAGLYKRIKIRTAYINSIDKRSPGTLFWNSLGIYPFAIDNTKPNHPEYVWDADLTGVNDLNSLKRKYVLGGIPSLHDERNIPDEVIFKAEEKGYKIL